jgi:hypothetical protein
MAEASDDLQHISGLGGDMSRDWLPTELPHDQLEVELAMMRNECLARANNLLEKEGSFRRYSLMAMASLPVAAFFCIKPYYFITEVQHRVERMRRPQKVKTARLVLGVLGTYCGFGLFLWPSSYGFRARADRIQRLAMYFDALSWDAGVLRHQLLRDTIDPVEILNRDAERRARAQEERDKDADAEEEEAKLAAMMFHPDPTEEDEEAKKTLDTPKEEVESLLKAQLMKEPEGEESEADTRPAVRDPYGAPLSWRAQEALERRYAAAYDLPPWSQLFHRLQERRYSLEQML